jgi:hypothetical protein
MITSWKALALFDHGGRDVDGIDSLDEACQRTRDKPGAAAEVEDGGSVVGDQPCQDVERLGRI